MPRITWGASGRRLYKSGIDRGVLYVGDNFGVPWNGIVSVDEKAAGGSASPSYIDGVKYLNPADPEETELTLTAFYSPEEFDACDGTAELFPGLFAGNSKKAEFGLCYRTRIGNDLSGTDYGYKIHLIYNATASPSNFVYETESDSLDIEPISWDLSTRPVIFSGVPATSKFELDTTRMSAGNVAYFERILYGDEATSARLPTIEEIFEFYNHAYGVAQYGISTYA